MEYIDYFGLEYIFKYAIFFGRGGEGYEESCYALCQLNQILGYQFFQVMSLGMNISLCIDLVLTLREPFYPAKRRLKFYLMSSFVLAVFIALTSIGSAKKTCLAPTSSGASNTQNAALAFLLSVYIIISLFSIVYAARMLSRPGISSDIRQIFMKKHVFYALSFIFIWSLILLNAYDKLYASDEKTDPDNDELDLLERGYTKQLIMMPMGFVTEVWVDPDKHYMDLNFLQVASFLASISTGLIMGVIRSFEPYFHFLLKKTIKAFYGIPLSEEEIDKNNSQLTDTIAAFLNSSLNIELVHIILKAITQECTKTSIPLNDWKSFVPLDQDFNEKKRYPITEIEVTDPQKWNLFENPINAMRLGIDVLAVEANQNETLIINEDISVTELAPKIFAIIRSREGITNQTIKESLSPELNRDSVFKAGEGQGKSGSFFFFSHDRRFIIKTMNSEEYNTFQSIFRKYFKHILKNEDSLIARIYGIFTVHKEKIQPVHLILMGNTVDLQSKGKGLKYIFDLKGSLVNRESKMKRDHKPSSTLKDINLLEIKKSHNLLKFTNADKKKIMSMIQKDVPLLKSGNIMDYSLLLAIEENPDYRKHAHTVRTLSKRSSSGGISAKNSSDGTPKSPLTDVDYLESPRKKFDKSRHMYLSSNLQYVYHLAIIDYLQDYNWDKKMEHFAKSIWRGRKSEISAVPPERYAKRYISFMEDQVIVADKKSMSASSDDMPVIQEEEDYKAEKIDW